MQISPLIRVALVDDDPHYRQMFASAVHDHPTMALVHSAYTGRVSVGTVASDHQRTFKVQRNAGHGLLGRIAQEARLYFLLHDPNRAAEHVDITGLQQLRQVLRHLGRVSLVSLQGR